VNLLQSLLSGNNASALNGAASGLGLGNQQTQTLIESLLPILARGLQRNSASGNGLEAIARALDSGMHDRYLADPATLASGTAVQDGNKILGHLLGGKDVSRNVAAHAANQTGIDYSIVKKFLPVLAAATMGALSQQNRAAPGKLTGQLPAAGAGGTGNPLSAFLDADHDGSIADDLLDLAGKFLR
jgi:hypothetical protein